MSASAPPDQETPPRAPAEVAGSDVEPGEADRPGVGWGRLLLLAPVVPILIVVHTLWARRRGILAAVGLGLLWYYLVHEPAP